MPLISAVRVLCTCGQPRIVVGADMLARRYTCNHCTQIVIY